VAERDLSVVVFGATGVTGRHVCAYLAQRSQETELRWAAAGRDAEKVRRVLGELNLSAPELVRADVGDRESLREMAARSRVVLNLVGPYTLYGEPVIEACIAAGTHHVDLTGEIPFVRRMIDSHQQQAEAARVKVVPTCGFESLPPDVAVLLAAETARERWGEELATADLDVEVVPPKGRRIGSGDLLSGGTMQSSAAALDDVSAAVVTDPAALVDEDELAARVRSRSPIALAPWFSADGEVVGPMLPAPFINPAVIQRTAALVARDEGRSPHPFRYRDGVVMPGGSSLVPLRYAAAAASAGLQAGFRALARARPAVRHRAAGLMRRALPSSGFGPSGADLERWRWRLAVNATTEGGHHVRVDLDADGHPGYLTTARMIGEAGLLLAEEGATPERSGFLTPASALGTGQLDRFESAGLRFRVSS
jgi:short subunit dehydrogenase-like uncharacterized protein